MRRKLGPARRAQHATPTSLEPSVLEAIELFTGILARCGASPKAMTGAFATACSRIPESLASAAGRATRELSNASHLLTVWFSDPMYLDAEGTPLRLPLHGPSPSLEALSQRVDPTLDVHEVVRYLRRNRALRKFGDSYSPLGPVLMLRGARGPDHFRHLRGVLAMLRTCEHNTRPKRRVPSWFERFAECPAFPKRALAAFDAHLQQSAMKFLRGEDAEMHRQELKRLPGEPVVRLGVGVYRFEEDVPGALARKRRKSLR